MNNKSSTEFVKLTKAETRKLSPIAKRDYQRKLKNVNQRIRRAKANAAKMNFNDNNGAPPAMANSKGTVKRSVRKQAPTSIATSNGTVKRSVRKQAPPAPSRVVLEAFKINRINNDGVTVRLFVRLFCCFVNHDGQRLLLTLFCSQHPPS